MSQPLIIVGAGGFGREVALAAEACDPPWTVSGFLDDHVQSARTAEGWLVLGGILSVQAGARCVVAIGNPRGRRVLADRLCETGATFATVDRDGRRHATVSISHGGMFVAGVQTTVNTQIGRHCIANLNCTIGHDVAIGDFVTIAPLVAISGNAQVGDGVEIGTGACVREGITIGPGAMIGMGSVVVKDVPANTLVVGNPARPVRELSPW